MLVNKGTNGTFVNGVLTSQAVVTEGILIELAKGGPLLQLNWQLIRPVSIPNTSGCTHAGNPPNNLFCIHCGLPIHIERSIRNYHVLRTLGQGGMGTTTLAWNAESSLPQTSGQTRIPALVVLKEMNADMAQIAKAQELFEREARTLKGLNHKGIPQFYDFFVEAGKKYLAMEMVHGQDLEKIVQHRGPVTPQQAIDWMIQTCEVLGYLHVQDPPIIHRDIKPANLLLRNLDQRIVVLDFGAVKEIGTPPGTRIGAEGYSAPEQDRGQPLTLSDLYAIGSTLIFLLTGESPLNFYGKRGSSYGFNLESVPTITPELRTVIERVTEYRPRDRYPDAQHLCQALRDCLN
jgi:serine/threonine-protein kinase